MSIEESAGGTPLLDVQGERLVRACAFARLLQETLKAMPEHFAEDGAQIYIYMAQLIRELEGEKKLYCLRTRVGLLSFENAISQCVHVHRDSEDGEGG